jgi:hypothetical protein
MSEHRSEAEVARSNVDSVSALAQPVGVHR